MTSGDWHALKPALALLIPVFPDRLLPFILDRYALVGNLRISTEGWWKCTGRATNQLARRSKRTATIHLQEGDAMLNSPAQSDIQRFTMANSAIAEEKLPISDDAQNGLSSIMVGLAGALLIALAILVLRLAGAVS
jgi:hypothetical protein